MDTNDEINSKNFGIVYTPASVAEYLSKKGIFYFIFSQLTKDGEKVSETFEGFDFYKHLDDNNLINLMNIIHNITILDPACGDGNLLVHAFHYLREINSFLKQRGLSSKDNLDVTRHILEENLFGVDISLDSIEECKHRLLEISGLNSDETCAFNLFQGNAIISSIKSDSKQNASIILSEDFSWCSRFPRIFRQGGFDLVISNPPWNVLKPLEKEFFSQFDSRLTKYNVDKKEARKIIQDLLKDEEIKISWTQYINEIKEQSKYFHKHYFHQSDYLTSGKARKRISGDINLYKLFLERIYYLTRKKGLISVIIPSGFHTDAGSKALRKLMFENGSVKELICFENRKGIFPFIHKSFKFDILMINKQRKTRNFKAGFMLNNISQIKHSTIKLNWEIIKRFSPSSLAVVELKTKKDVEIVEKLYQHPALQKQKQFKLTREFDITLDSHLFNISNNGMILFEGKMIEQYTHQFKSPRYWITEENVHDRHGATYKEYKEFRLGFRAIAASTNRRTMISTILPPNICCGNSIIITRIFHPKTKMRLILLDQLLYLNGVFNSFIFDYLLRLKVTTNINMFIIYEMPVPIPDEFDSIYKDIIANVKRIYKDSFFRQEKEDYSSPSEEFKIDCQAEIEILLAKLYRLSPEDIVYILDQFHLNDPNKNLNLKKLKKAVKTKLNRVR